jgi:hypothetical protein
VEYIYVKKLQMTFFFVRSILLMKDAEASHSFAFTYTAQRLPFHVCTNTVAKGIIAILASQVEASERELPHDFIQM